MAITRKVDTDVYCDICGKWVMGWTSNNDGVSRAWAAKYARKKGWLQLHNNQVEDRKKIYTGVVTIHDSNDSLYRITDRENTLEAIRDKLVDRLGGYLRLRHENDKLYLDWLTIQEYGKYCEQPIQFGENLMDYSETMTADDVITALIPLGAAIEQETDENASEFERLEKNVDITSVNDGKDYIYSKEAVENFGWVWRTEKWDDVSVPANLLKKATEFLTSNQYESLVISLTAVDLSLFGQDYDSFDIGDRVLCNAIPYGMKKVLPVMEMKIPLQQPDQAQLTLGENLQQSFTDQTSGTFTQIRQETKRDVYICMDASLLTTDMNAAKTRYKKVAAQVTYTAASWKYISKCFVDPALGIMVPTETKAGSTTGFCNGLYTDSGTSGQREWLSLGRLGHGTIYGLWILFAGNGVGGATWDIVSGVSPNGTRGEWQAAA